MSGAKRKASPVIARNWARSERGTFGRATLIRRLPLRGRGLLASCLQMPTPQHNELVRLKAIDALDHRFDDPSEELLWQIISGLTPDDNYFVMVQHVPGTSQDGTYIPNAIFADGHLKVEYQDGDLQHHYSASVDSARQAHEVVAAWAFERPGWRAMLPWELEKLG